MAKKPAQPKQHYGYDDIAIAMGYAPGIGSFGVPVSASKYGAKPGHKFMQWPRQDLKGNFLRLKKLAAKMDEGGE